MEFYIPDPLKIEHEELHTDLAKATKAGGKIGEAAGAVEQIMHPHFIKDEEFALPPLGLLTRLAKGELVPEVESVLKMTDKLKAEISHMVEEHKAIVAALEKLSDAARREGKLEHLSFSEKLILHAQTEEEVLYPAAIVVGEYLKTRP